MIRHLAVCALFVTAAACTTFSATPAADDAGARPGDPTVDAAADGGGSFCQSVRSMAGPNVVACEDFEGPKAASGFIRVPDSSLELDIVDGDPGDPTRSGAIRISPNATGSAGLLASLAGGGSSYHFEGSFRLEGNADTSIIVAAMKLTSTAGERDLVVLASSAGATVQICDVPGDGGAPNCEAAVPPQPTGEWTHVVLDFDATAGAASIVLGNGTSMKPVAGLGPIAGGSVAFGGVSVPPQKMACIVHIDDVLATTR